MSRVPRAAEPARRADGTPATKPAEIQAMVGEAATLSGQLSDDLRGPRTGPRQFQGTRHHLRAAQVMRPAR